MVVRCSGRRVATKVIAREFWLCVELIKGVVLVYGLEKGFYLSRF